MKRFQVLAAVAMLTFAGAAMADDKAKEDQASPDKKVCRSERATGSLTRVTRVCMTQAEWDKLRERTNSEMGRMDASNSRFSSQATPGARPN